MSNERAKRRLAAILAADVVGFSQLMNADEEDTLARLKSHRLQLIDPTIAECRGRIVKTTGDGLLVEFSSAVDAVRCAVAIQQGMAARNAAEPQDKRIDFRIGVNVGDIIFDEGDIFGSGVNVAARLEKLSRRGGICVSGRVREDMQGKLDIAFDDGGMQKLKNIEAPLQIFHVRMEGSTAGGLPGAAGRRWNPLLERNTRRDARTCAVALAIMSIFVVLNLVSGNVAWMRQFEDTALDLRLKLRGPLQPGNEIVILMIDDKTLAEQGRWPLPRAKFAQVVDFLHRAGAKVIAFDILFIDPEANAQDGGDEAFARAIRDAGNVVLPFTYSFDGDQPAAAPPYLARSAYTAPDSASPMLLPLQPKGIVTPITPLAEAAAGLGHTLVAFDVDGAPRYDYPVLEYDGHYYPSLPMRAAQIYLGIPWETVTIQPGEGIALGPVWLPTDALMRTVVNYRGPPGTYSTLSFSDALAGTIPTALLQNRVVLIGTSIVGIKDSFHTPYSSVLPGVERLATLVDSTLHGDAIRRLGAAPWIESGILLLGALALGIGISRMNIVPAAVMMFGLLMIGIGGEQIALARSGFWFMLVVPTLGWLATFGGLMLYRAAAQDRDRRDNAGNSAGASGRTVD